MQFKIDMELCQGHGECEMEAPEIFRVVTEGGRGPSVEVLLEDPPESMREKLQAAIRYCPNRVIAWRTEDSGGP